MIKEYFIPAIFVTIMTGLLIMLVAFILSGCSAMLPGLFDDVEKVLDNTAVQVQIDKAAMQKETDVDINVQISNKDKK